jgi:uncharacterized delta-60 repeat protein
MRRARERFRHVSRVPARRPRPVQSVEPLEPRRLLSAGDLDASFGGTGKVLTDLPGSQIEFGSGTAVQADGKVIAAGYVQRRDDPYVDFLVARYNANGSLDTTFGGGKGYATVDFDDRHDVAYDVALAPGNKIIVSGYSATTVLPSTLSGGTRESGRDFAVARLNSNGSLDASFDGDGKRLIDVGSEDVANDLVVRPDGGLYLVGDKGTPGSETAIVALRADGSLDAAFDGDGLLVPKVGAGGAAAALDANGRLVVAADERNSFAGPTHFFLGRFNPNGTLDTTFGGGSISPTAGVVTVSDRNPFAMDLAIAPDGKIVAGGAFGAVRVNANGSPDTGFSGDGKTGGPAAWGVAVAADRSVLVVGFPIPAAGAPYVPRLARYLEDGSPDPSFNATPAEPVGQVRNGTGAIRAVALTADGGSVTVGNTQTDALGNVDLVVTRRLANGALAPTFSPGGADGDGVAVSDLAGPSFEAASDVLTLGDDSVLAIGPHWTGRGTGYDFALARYTAAGLLDTTFGTGGVVFTDNQNLADVPTSLALQSDGKIVAAGRSGNDVLVVRFHPDGSPDATFGDGGRLVIPTIEGRPIAPVRVTNPAVNPPPALATVLGDDRILIATTAGATRTDYRFALARLTADGRPDTTFGGGDGFVVVPQVAGSAAALALAPAGRFVVSGNGGDAGAPGTVYVARFTAGGALDANSFGFPGYVTGPSAVVRGLAVAPDGAVTVGASTDTGATGDFLLLRYLADGQTDRSFDGDGQAVADFGGNWDTLRDIALLPDGSVVAVGGSAVGVGMDPATADVAVARFTAAGGLDPTFGAGDGAADGMLKLDLAGKGDAAHAVAIDSLGRLVLAGGAFVAGRSSDFALVRLEGAGAPGPVVESASLAAASWGADFRSALAAAGNGADGGFLLQRRGFVPLLPWTNLDRVTVRFRGPAGAISRDDLRVRGVNVAAYDVADFAYDPAAGTATWRLARPVENDKLVVELNTNSEPAAEYQWRVNVLAGDSTADGVVNASDLGDLKRRLNRSLASPGSGTSAYSVYADFTGDGKINALDLGAVKQRLNRRLPAGTPASLGSLRVDSVTAELFGTAPILEG